LSDTLLSGIDNHELNQSTDEDSELDDDILKESALVQFNTILQKAQQVAAQAERERRKICKQLRTYSGKSKRMLKWQKQLKDNLEQKGFLSVFDFITFIKKKNHPPESKQAQSTAVDSIEIQTDQALQKEEEEEEEEEDDNDDEDAGDWTSWWINKVCYTKLLRCTD
jgi:hypothetical protein